ncbi:hypothetical protein D3C76_648050 [compost metagenome]
MTNSTFRGWRWAYQKLRNWYVSPIQSVFRATLFSLRGDTGVFYSHGGQRKSRIVRDGD